MLHIFDTKSDVRTSKKRSNVDSQRTFLRLDPWDLLSSSWNFCPLLQSERFHSFCLQEDPNPLCRYPRGGRQELVEEDLGLRDINTIQQCIRHFNRWDVYPMYRHSFAIGTRYMSIVYQVQFLCFCDLHGHPSFAEERVCFVCLVLQYRWQIGWESIE